MAFDFVGQQIIATSLGGAVLLGVFAAMPISASAAEAPIKSEDGCLNESATQTEINVCSDRLTRKIDAERDQLYRSLLKKLEGGDEYDVRAQARLRDAERAWINYRDKACTFETSDSEGGSMHLAALRLCLVEKTRLHIEDMKRQLNCSEGDDSCVYRPAARKSPQ